MAYQRGRSPNTQSRGFAYGGQRATSHFSVYLRETKGSDTKPPRKVLKLGLNPPGTEFLQANRGEFRYISIYIDPDQYNQALKSDLSQGPKVGCAYFDENRKQEQGAESARSYSQGTGRGRPSASPREAQDPVPQTQDAPVETAPSKPYSGDIPF